MQKYLLSILSIFLVLAGVPYAYTKGASKGLAPAIQREVAKRQPSYANDRVKTLCEEWPTCEEFVRGLASQGIQVQVVDAEVEYWVRKWNAKNEAIWAHRFYIQTKENGQLKSYVFAQLENGGWAAPVQIKKFPGHPIAGKPSEHVVPHLARNYSYDKDSFNRNACEEFPGCRTFAIQKEMWPHFYAVETQFISKFDGQGNAVWNHNLCIEHTFFRNHQAYLFKSFQVSPQGAYTYPAPKKVNTCPARSRAFPLWYPF